MAVWSIVAKAGDSRDQWQNPQGPGQQPWPQGQHPDPHLPAAVVDEPQVDADPGFNLYEALHHGSPWHRDTRSPGTALQVALLLALGSALFWAPAFP